MADDSTTIELTGPELREVAGYSVACAPPALVIIERERPDDRRPRAATDAAQAFANRCTLATYPVPIFPNAARPG